MTNEEIRDRVTYHAPSPAGIERHATLSAVIEQAMIAVRDTVPPGREQSLAFTHLEDAKFWASAGVARNPNSR